MNTPAIAILFADRDGVYSSFPVDIWDKSRDARCYDGDSPVVAHPPCESWGKLYAMKKGRRLGDDDGCFAAALAAVERVGGVLEHPEGSFAWPKFGLLPRSRVKAGSRTLSGPAGPAKFIKAITATRRPRVRGCTMSALSLLLPLIFPPLLAAVICAASLAVLVVQHRFISRRR